MYIAIANAIYSSLLQGSRGGFPQACFGLDYNAITSDFTFTRNSFATRVNEFGLIETVTDLGSDLIQNGSFDELGSELITNGDFENGETDWGFGGDWTLVNGTAEILTSTNSFLTQSNVIPLTVKTYKIQYEVVTTNGSNFRFAGGSSAFGTVTLDSATVGVKTVYLTSNGTNGNLQFNQNAFRGSIDNVSVKQVDPNDDWSKLNATISDSKGNLDGDGQTSLLYQDILTDTKTYTVTFTVSDYNGIGTSVVINNNGTTLYEITSDGTFTFTFTHSIANGNFLFRATNGAIFSIENVSVQEVLEDDVPRIDYTGSTFDVPVLGSELVTNGTFDTDINGWVKGSGTTNPISWDSGKMKVTNDVALLNSARQSITTVIGKTYLVTADVDSTNGVNPRLATSNPTTAIIGTGGTIETLSYTFVATSTFSEINLYNWQNTLGAYNLWDNVSVKEVTAYTTTDKGAFLLEPISTNLLTYSEDFSQWSTFGSPVRTGGQDDLSGNTNAYAIEFPTSNDFVRITGINTVGTFTCSVYAKKSIGDKWYFNCDGKIGRYNFATESFTAGTGSPTGDMINVGDGWYRCTMTYNSVNPSSQARIQSNDGSTVILWGAQLEALPYATSYIPTSGTTVTRAQESCVDATPTINSEEGVLYAEISALANEGTNRSITLNSGSSSNRVYLSYASGSNRLRIILNNSSGTQVDKTQTISSITNLNKIAFKYKENDFALWVNGVEVYTDTLGTTFPQGTLTELDFNNGSGSSIFYGRTKDLRVYCKALTDDELTELTTI